METHERTAVLADNHPMWLDVIEQLLEKVGIVVVARTTSVADAAALVAEHHPDVLITELGPGDDRVVPIRDALAADARLKTIVLSASDSPEDINGAFTAGASIYCVKTAAHEDIAAAIRQAFSSSIFFARAGAPPREARGDGGRAAAARAELTARESEILALAADGYSNAQLAKMLWVTEQTVKFHLSNIYRKLDVSNRTEAARWAHRHGLVADAREHAAA
jgi:DNA-binding NarL/FixJ family response regulator